MLWAGGSKEDPIQAANKYIQDKQYDQALNLLSDIIKKNPERMDEAQALVNAVMEIKGGYNKALQELVTSLKNDPGNYEKALQLIDRMASLDPNPSVKIKKDIEGFRITAKLNKTRFDKNQLMARALAQVQAKQYADSIDTYLGGFTLALDDFQLGTQKAEFRKAVLDQTELVRQAVTRLKTENTNLQPSLQSFATDIKAGKNGLDGLAGRFGPFAEQFLKTVSQTTALEKSADDMSALRQRSDSEYPPDNENYNYNEYIRIIQELMQGPAGKADQGIRFAARSLIDAEYGDILNSLAALYTERKQEFEAQASRLNDADLLASLRLVILSGTVLMRAQGLQGNLDLGTAPSFADIAGKLPALYRTTPAVVLGELKSYQQFQADNALAANYQRLKASKAPTVWQEAIAAWDGGQANLVQWEKDVKQGMDAGLLDGTQYQRLKAIFNNLHETSQTGLLSLAREQYSTAVAGQLAQIRQLFVAQAPEEKRADVLLTGTTVSPNGQVVTGNRFPDQALVAYNGIKAKYLSQLNALDLLDKDLGVVRGEISAFKPVQTTIESSRTLRRDITAGIARLDGGIAKSQGNIRLAQDNIQKAQQAMGLIDAAIQGTRPDIATANARYADASQYYFNAFDLAYNADQRSQADVRLKELYDRIETARNNLLRDQISAYITNIGKLFEQAEYARAGEDISKAIELDNQTSAYKNALASGKKPEEARDKEINYWNARIQAAINLSSERTISETDPNFNSLANYINLVQLDYNQISQLMKNNQKAQTANLVKRANQNINNVLLVKPSNFEAKLLQLRVTQVSDPEVFKRLFPTLVKNALDKANGELRNRNASNATLTELQALSELDPKYPGINQAIIQMEILLGIRPNPKTEALNQEVNRLLRLALDAERRGSQTDLRTALGYLDQAIVQDATRADVRDARNRIAKKIREIPYEQSSADLAVFLKAQDYLNTSQPERAGATLRALLEKAPNYPQYLKLQNQINQQLGQ